jgi:hypothetical protein
VVSRHLSGGTEENQKILRIAGVPAEIRTNAFRIQTIQHVFGCMKVIKK